jgi:hypothetical protein
VLSRFGLPKLVGLLRPVSYPTDPVLPVTYPPDPVLPVTHPLDPIVPVTPAIHTSNGGVHLPFQLLGASGSLLIGALFLFFVWRRRRDEDDEEDEDEAFGTA